MFHKVLLGRKLMGWNSLRSWGHWEAGGAKAQHRAEIGHKSRCIFMDTSTEHHSSAPGNLCPQGMGTVLIPGALQGDRSSFHTQSLQGIPGHPGSWSSKWLLSGKTETGGIKPAVPLGTLLQNWIFFLLLEFPYPAGQQGTFYLLDPPSLGL